jgi:uncharacterized protein
MDQKDRDIERMDKTAALNVAKIYANCVRDKYNLVRVILFGSFAKGNYTEDSDIDIAVVLKDFDNLLDMQLELMRLRRKIDSRIEPHPFRENEFNLSNPLVSEIIRFGEEID